MLIRYPDGTVMWRCDRCAMFHSSRIVALRAKMTPLPFGWSGDAINTMCFACVQACKEESCSDVRTVERRSPRQSRGGT